ncbi:hypothetical protein FLONG3_2468 [Fusarium longipes]|uniref:BZIP domain-containing protein n=1 Tax=Fusarium longipes TaxID=694270 RepID=A0A395T3W2_9HYPO|nr:hypothetical protein FLONG3_2468 [Fusarium longipes]
MDQSSVAMMDQMYDLPGIGRPNCEPHPLWDQWYFAGESSFHGSFPMPGNDYQEFAEIEGFMPDLIHDPQSTAGSSSFFTQDSLVDHPAPDSTIHRGSSSTADYSLHPSPTQPQPKKRKSRHTQSISADPSSSRRGSIKKQQTEQASADEITISNQDYEIVDETSSSPSEHNAKTRKLRERNSRAANKVRSKKREV